MKRKITIVLGLLLTLAFDAGATELKHLGSPAQQRHAQEWNRTHPMNFNLEALTGAPVLKPFSEAETTGYVAISSTDAWELAAIRSAIAKNLPPATVLIIFVSDSSEVRALKKLYSPYLKDDQLKFLVVPTTGSSDTIWARDSLPFPVYLQTPAKAPVAMGLVDSLYPQDFEPDSAFAKAFSYPMVSTNQYFRGGNLLFDTEGNCFSENVNETQRLSDPEGYLKKYFGCTTVTLLEQEGGIGDIDERIKFLTGKDVLTDNATYAGILKNKGYTVHMMPTTGKDGETYMNTLLVNGTMFVPQMGIKRDADAIKAYQDLGFKAVGVMTKQLADRGDGNIHCVTMNYPPGAFQASARGGDFVDFSRATR